MIILAIQSTYTSIEVGLYKKNSITSLGCASIPKDKTASILSVINVLLINSSLTIKDISLCLVNRGPAPFTTLRTVIAIANGLKASLHIPLIGIQGLNALDTEYMNKNKKSIILLNAFAGNFYFYINDLCKGICSTEQIKVLIQKNTIETIIGNGGPLIKNAFSQEHAYQFLDPEKGCCSLNALVTYGYQYVTHSLNNSLPNEYVSPLYFKEVTLL